MKCCTALKLQSVARIENLAVSPFLSKCFKMFLVIHHHSFPGEQLAVFRGQDGKAYVLDAYCPHLGANLAVGGRVVGSCIECPFHGWQFQGNDGKCVRVPYAEKGTN